MIICIPKEMLHETISNGLDSVIQQLTKEIGQSLENENSENDYKFWESLRWESDC